MASGLSRVPVVVGVGQVSQRDLPDEAARRRSSCSRTRPRGRGRRGRRAARARPTSSRSCRSSRGPTPIPARCSLAASASRRGDRGLDGRRQQPAAARQRVGRPHPARRVRRRAHRRRREHAHALAGAPRATRRARVGVGRRRAVPVGDRRRPAGHERRGDAPRRRRADAWCTRCSRPRCAPRRVAASTRTSATSASCGRRSRPSPPTIRTRGRGPRTHREEIRTVTPDNRMVVFPYAKRMCANIDVDQGAALILCSYEAAQRAGVADDRMVFLHAAAEAHDHWFVTERDSLDPFARDRGRRRRRARRRAARVSTTSPTSTSTRASRPRCRSRSASSASDGCVATAHRHRRPRLRGRSGQQLPDARRSRAWSNGCAPTPVAYGLTTALGWYVTKHAAGVWSARPPEAGFRRVDPHATQARVDCQPAARAGRARRRRRRRRGDVGRVRARRRADVAASSPRCSPTAGAAIADVPRDRAAARVHRGRRGKAAACASRTTASTNTVVGKVRRCPTSRVAARCCGEACTRRCARCGSGKLFRHWFHDGRRLPALRAALRARAGLLRRRARDQHVPRRRAVRGRVHHDPRADDPRHPDRRSRSRSASRSSCSDRSSPIRSRRRSGSRSTARSCSSWTSTSSATSRAAASD